MTRTLLSAGLVAMLLLMTGCGSGSSPNFSDDRNEEPEVDPLPEDHVESVLGLSNLCEGESISGIQDYDATQPGVHSFALFKSSSDYYMSDYGIEFPENWTASHVNDNDDYASTELVACLDIAQDTAMTESCDYGDGYFLQTYGANYELNIYNAGTNELIAEESFYLPADICPDTYYFYDYEFIEKSTPDHDSKLIELMTPYVETQ